ncbi:unnamed protein product [Prorocentrum cordatum]|uniref:Uncharacterized protein n=1 Tax=Prorocentrum cordatum TaxID=2364126 RepID=A0ABN9VS46_9DINO|nr:unnamed protein product [Polarella glacialis]
MVYRSPWLQRLPRVCLDPERESGYAVGECLVALESDAARARRVDAALSRIFSAMVEQQASFVPAGQGAQGAPGPRCSSWCLVRWQRSAEGVILRGLVQETLRKSTYEEALARAKGLSAGKAAPQRLHVVPLDKVRRTKRIGALEFVEEGPLGDACEADIANRTTRS